MISAIWLGLTLTAFILAYRRFYLSGTVLLCSTTLLVKIFPGVYIWDIFFIFVLCRSVFSCGFSLNLSHVLFTLIFTSFLTLNAFLAAEYFSLIEVGRLGQFCIFCLCLHSHYSKNPVERIFIHAVFVSLLLNLSVHFLQIFGYDFAFSLKPTGAVSIGGFFNDSSEFGPIALLSALIFYSDSQKLRKLQLFGLPMFAACFAVVVSFNRTSFMLLPVFAIGLFTYSKVGVKAMVLVFAGVVLPFGLSYANKNFDLVYALLNDPSALLGGTVELRIINWQSIFSHYVNHCSVIFGCAPGLFDVNRHLFTSNYGVFSVDNAFLRVIVSYGLLGASLFISGMFYLFRETRSHWSLWIIIFGLGMMIELYKSLPVVLVLICCFAYLLTRERSYVLERK